jgi:hypothetical protein
MVYEPGQISERLAARIEQFRFPPGEYPLDSDRRKEVEIDRLYDNRSIVIVYLRPADNQTILSTARIIVKNGSRELLPIEYGRVTAASTQSGLLRAPVKSLEIGASFSIEEAPGVFPVCEIGGLRAAKTNRAVGITMLDRYAALREVLNTSFNLCFALRFRSAFLTCAGSPNVVGIYRDRYNFREIAEVSYGPGKIWKALWRSADSDVENRSMN